MKKQECEAKGDVWNGKDCSVAPSKKELAKIFKSSIGMEFTLIPAGEFIMGCSDGDNGCQVFEKPAHKVKITKAFYMGKYEVTQKQWKVVMGKNPSHFTSCGENCPVEKVSGKDVNEFLRVLNKKESREWESRFRLPTEAEWEYAARAGIKTKTYSNELNHIAWHIKNSDKKTHPVGQKEPNLFGLYDMLGNVWEWCEDSYGDNYYSASDTNDPKGSSTGEYQIFRGSSWFSNINYFRVSYRGWVLPSRSSNDVGFRLVAPVPYSLKWSEYQGTMNWEDAKAKCASIGMRLPTWDELKEVPRKIRELWKENENWCWSSTPDGEDRAYTNSIYNHGFSGLRTDDRDVRCVR